MNLKRNVSFLPLPPPPSNYTENKMQVVGKKKKAQAR